MRPLPSAESTVCGSDLYSTTFSLIKYYQVAFELRQINKPFPYFFLVFSCYFVPSTTVSTIKANIILSQLDNGGQPDIAESNTFLNQLISVGDTKVGKSCIIKRYCEGRFVQKYITTIGVDYGVKKVTVSGRKVAVNFFDLSGSADY